MNAAAAKVIEILRSMSTPAEEWAAMTDVQRIQSGSDNAEEYQDALSSDRMEDDAMALWRLIDMVRDYGKERANKADAAIQRAAMALGSTDEWSDQESMIADFEQRFAVVMRGKI